MMDEKTVKKLFGNNKDLLKKVIQKAIIIKDENNIIMDEKAPKFVHDIISELLNLTLTGPLFTDEEIITSLLKVLNANSIKYDKVKLLKQKDKIILALLVLIHHTEIKDIKINCKIYCHIYFDVYTKKLILNLSFLVPNNEYFAFAYEAIKTNLSMQEYCSAELLERHKQDLIEQNGSVFNSVLGLNEDFKLVEKKLDM
jgi:hypothetical protein